MINAFDLFIDNAFGFSDIALGSAKFGTFGQRHTTATGCARICAKKDWGDAEQFICDFVDQGRHALGD